MADFGLGLAVSFVVTALLLIAEGLARSPRAALRYVGRGILVVTLAFLAFLVVLVVTRG